MVLFNFINPLSKISYKRHQESLIFNRFSCYHYFQKVVYDCLNRMTNLLSWNYGDKIYKSQGPERNLSVDSTLRMIMCSWRSEMLKLHFNNFIENDDRSIGFFTVRKWSKKIILNFTSTSHAKKDIRTKMKTFLRKSQMFQRKTQNAKPLML